MNVLDILKIFIDYDNDFNILKNVLKFNKSIKEIKLKFFY